MINDYTIYEYRPIIPIVAIDFSCQTMKLALPYPCL